MARQGRELERLAATLEAALRPEGIQVKSPDYVLDTITGRMREVDVSIRADGASPIHAICECRDRRSVADVTWVEQVVTKARDLEGEPTVVLVSSSGFTEQARKKAGSYGHDVRLISDVSVETFRAWFHAEYMTIVVTSRRLHGCEIRLTQDDADDFSHSTCAAIEEHGVDALIFKRHSLEPLSASQLFDEWYSRNREQVERDVSADGRPVRRKIPIHFSDPERSLAIESSAGRRAVAEIALLVEITRKQRLIRASRATRYANENHELAQSIEFRLEEDLGTVSLHRMSDASTSIYFRPPDK